MTGAAGHCQVLGNVGQRQSLRMIGQELEDVQRPLDSVAHQSSSALPIITVWNYIPKWNPIPLCYSNPHSHFNERSEPAVKDLISHQLVKYLEGRGIEHIFGLCGHTNIAV